MTVSKQPYLEACEALQIPTLKDRRESLCKKTYSNLCVTLVINCTI